MISPIHFIVDGDPIAQPRHRDRAAVKKGGRIWHPKYDPAARKKEDFLRRAMRYRPPEPLDGPLEVNITFWFKRPLSHFGCRQGRRYLKASAPVFHTLSRMDRDNLDKFVLDALAGIFWTNDGIVCRGTLQKRYSLRSPYTEIEIKSLRKGK